MQNGYKTRYHTVHGNFPAKSKEVPTYEVQKTFVPLALALAIASTAAAEAARLPQNRFSFAVRPSYTQTVSRPSASKPLQSTTANSSYAAQVVSLVNAERARQGLPALTISTAVQQAAQTRAGELQTSFSHTRPSGASCFTALTEAGVSLHPCR